MKKPMSPMFQAISKVGPFLDRQLSPFGAAAMDVSDIRAGDRVLDLGCGAGETPLQLSQRVGKTGQVVGVDIAPDILALGKRRKGVETVEFVACDAGDLPFATHSFDKVFSRFGVMGLSDPVAGFTGIRRVLVPDGTFAFCCWRALPENEIDHLPVTVAGRLDQVKSTPFRFADRGYLDRTLRAAGFRDIRVTPMDCQVSCGGVEETLETMLSVGALGQMVREDPSIGIRVAPDLRRALAERTSGGDVYLGGAVWIVSARA